MTNFEIFTISLLISMILICIYSTIGYFTTYKSNKKFQLVNFHNTLFGCIVTIGIYALIKSHFQLNSVTITLIPIFLLLRFWRTNPTELAKTNFPYLFFGFVLIVINFTIYFKPTYINTGYGDHSWYHIIASNINIFGTETADSAFENQPFNCGIYHYWELWHQSLTYDIGKLCNLNTFEAYVLIHKVVLSLIILIGSIELFVKLNIKSAMIPGLAIIAILGLNNEFNILIHPKQFITFSTLLLIFLQHTKTNKVDFNLFLFILFTNLFYSPLAGITIIAALALYCTIEDIRNLKKIIPFGILTLAMFIFLYFRIYQIPTTEIGKITFELKRFFNHFIFYNVYHTTINNWVVLLIVFLNLILINSIKFTNRFELLFFISILLFGSLFSSLLAFWKEQFQFMNNIQFMVALLFFKTLSEIQIKLPRTAAIITYFISSISVFQFLSYQKLRYYQPYHIDYDDYQARRDKKTNNLIRIQDEKKSFATRWCYEEDILYSIENKAVQHKNFQSTKKAK
jgi:hypothetical protein